MKTKFDTSMIVSVVQEQFKKELNQSLAESITSVTDLKKRYEEGVIDESLDLQSKIFSKALDKFSSQNNISDDLAVYGALIATFGADIKPPYDYQE
ncbi:hypothetical protein [Lactobacillus acetotolerans]|uniref:hypothetical protein n=1 Tax=Lactobacillus acetotolerans TaxID=1600 RepID=UPI002FDA68A1